MFITDIFMIIGQTSVARSQVKWTDLGKTTVFTITPFLYSRLGFSN